MSDPILIVEDDQDFCRLLEIYLSRAHTITFAHKAVDAERLLAHHQYCCVLFDVSLPDKSGWELLPAIRENAANPIPVAMTGRSDDATSEQAATLGVEHLITKPTTPMQIKALLNQLLGT